MGEKKLTIGEQVGAALDGRSQRWLAMKIGVHESDLSKKMKGEKLEFTEEEIEKINIALDVKIKVLSA